MKKPWVLFVFFMFAFSSMSFCQTTKEKLIQNIMDEISHKKKNSLNSRAMQAHLGTIEKEMPSKLRKLPERDVRFFDCVMSSLSFDKYLELLDYLYLNPDFRKDIQRHQTQRKVYYTIGRMSSIFVNQSVADRFAVHAYRCK